LPILGPKSIERKLSKEQPRQSGSSAQTGISGLLRIYFCVSRLRIAAEARRYDEVIEKS